MNDSQEFLTKRIDDMREDYTRRFENIEAKLDDIAKWMRASPQCPEPGACVEQRRILKDQNAALQKLDIRISSIERWQNKVIGIGSVLIALATLFGPTFRALMGLGN